MIMRNERARVNFFWDKREIHPDPEWCQIAIGTETHDILEF